MRIAINTRFLLKSKMEGIGWFTYEVVSRIVRNHPEHEFIFFFDRPFDSKFIFSDNVTPVVLLPPARHPILFKIWFDFSVYRALKKYKIDLFFSPDGYLSLKTNVPQIGVIHDINFEHFPESIPVSPRKYLKKYFPLFAQKAHHIITVSEFSKQDISTIYNIKEDKITVAHNGASTKFAPISDEEKESIKDTFSQGKEYFLFVGALHARKNLARLLLAFDKFKEQDKNDIQLVIVGENLWKKQSIGISEKALTYKSDIHFTGHVDLSVLTKITASALAMTFVSYFEGFGIPLVEAMQSGVPLVSSNKTSLPEVAGDAALYVDPFDIEDITSKMREIAENRTLRESLIEKGFLQAKKFSWDFSADICWQVIERVAGKV